MGCHIFNAVGIKAQETLLGYYEYKGVKRVAVACKDFALNGYALQDFASIKNQIIDSGSNGYGTELSDIIEAIEKQAFMDPIELMEHFWNMFVVDALIGNWDRYNGNWGFLYNQENDEIRLAPIFDCGSSLFPQADENMLSNFLKNKSEFEARVYDYPTSSLVLSGKRINYCNFINSHMYKACDDAIKRIKPKINLAAVNAMIDNVDILTEVHKTFLKKIIEARYQALFDE